LPPLARVKKSTKRTQAREIPRKRPITRPATEKAGARAAASDTLPAEFAGPAGVTVDEGETVEGAR